MSPRLRHSASLLLSATLLAMLPMPGFAAQTTLTINATIVEVQCTSEQRQRIRACAPSQEKWSVEAAKSMIEFRADGNGTGAARPVYQEIRRDELRPVLVRTVYY